MLVEGHSGGRIVLSGLISMLLLSSYIAAAHAFSNGQAASLVMGGFGRPDGVAFDSSGNLWVADGNYNRVVEFEPPFSNNEAPSLVIGQSSFTEFASATTQTGLSHPENVVFDASGNLWVTDYVNNRILEFKTPFSTGEAASLVIGKPNFTSTASSATPTTTSGAEVPAFDSSGNLWFADFSHSRMLEFKPPFTTGEAASLVIGQANFTSNVAATTKTGLNSPHQLSFDSSGNLWVPDAGNGRVLEFSPPITTTSSQASSTSNSTSSAQGGGIPEFPYQLVAAAILTILIVASFLLVRRRSVPSD